MMYKYDTKLLPSDILLIQKVLSDEGLLYAAPSQTWTKEAISAINAHQRRNKVGAPMCNMTPQNFGSLSKKLQDILEKQTEIKTETTLGDDDLKNISKEVEAALNSVDETEKQVTEVETEVETEKQVTEVETEKQVTEVETEVETGNLNAFQSALLKLKKKN